MWRIVLVPTGEERPKNRSLRHAGKGFYDWPAGRAVRVIRWCDEILVEMVKWLRARGFLRIPPDQRRDKADDNHPRGKLK
jgi:hypothetical protein